MTAFEGKSLLSTKYLVFFIILTKIYVNCFAVDISWNTTVLLEVQKRLTFEY